MPLAAKITTDRTAASKRPVTRPAPHHPRITPISSPPTNSVLSRKLTCSCGGSCPKCQSKLGIQPKLKIGAPNDKYEQEADRVADQVMRMPAPQIQRQDEPEEETEEQTSDVEELQAKPFTGILQRQADTEEEVEEDNTVQTKTAPGHTPIVAADTHGKIQSLKGAGHPLPTSTRHFFESRMGRDFSGVCIHSNSQAAETAQIINARAFTLGNDIVFNKGEYSPDVNTGKRLLAHELTHTVQQRTTRGILSRVPQPQPALPGTTATKPASTVINTSSGPMSRVEFERRMNSKFGVTTIKTGTYAEQNKRVGVTIPAAQWQSWDPGNSSIIYRYIFNAFDDFAWTFNGLPNVKEIVFYNMHFLNQAGVAVSKPNVGASFGAGELTIYSHASATTARMGLPFARSNTSGNYPGAPILTVVGTGTTPGAPIGYPTQEQGVKRVIWHELGHGLAEAALNPCGSKPAPDPALLRDYQQTVGWHGGHLFDIGNAAVATALAAGGTPPAGSEITQNDWNDPKWNEQPISAYMVSAPAEDFAEAVRVFVENPNLLQSRSPARHLFIATRANAFTQCLRQVLRPGDYPIPGDNVTRLA